MLQSELNRCVARATGETVSTIARLGFILSEPTEHIDDPHSEELGPLVFDWDARSAELGHDHIATALDQLFA